MFQGKTFLAIIPARGGSKGIPRKNIKLFSGKPLIAWTILESKQSKYIDRIILSSEDEEIIKIAMEYGCEVPFMRPLELAADDTTGIDIVINALDKLKEKYDYVILLQPTSPLRISKHIDSAIEFLFSNGGESLVSICDLKKSPYWMYSLGSQSNLVPLLPTIESFGRQDLPVFFTLNGAIYISNTLVLIEKKTFLTDNTVGYLMDRESSIDIDDDLDWFFAEQLKRR